jgi:hypothetical protein
MANLFNIPDITKCWYPVKFKTTDNHYTFKLTEVLFNNKSKFNFLECLKDYKSFSINKKTGLFLTNLKNPIDFLEENPPENFEKLTSIRTLLATKDLSYDKILENVGSLFVTDKAANVTVPLIKPVEYLDKDAFILNFIKRQDNLDEDYVSIQAVNDNTILTWGPDPYDVSKYEIKFKPQNFPQPYTQLFSYFLSENGICLFIPNTNYSQALRRNISSQGVLADLDGKIYKNSAYQIIQIDPRKDDVLTPLGFLKFVSAKSESITYSSLNKLKGSLFKYETNVLNSNKVLNPDPNFVYPYIQNYLAFFPIENPSLSDSGAIYELNFHSLKNYQTPEYKYSLNSNLSGNLRNYNRIFTGSNQTNGLPNVFLGYEANSTEKIFKNNSDTFFSYPGTAPRKSIHLSNLAEDGATPGHHPYISDRIYVKQIDYKSIIPEYIQPTSIAKYTNTWLCSWFSLSENGKGVWKDRFYNAAYYSAEEALSAQYLDYTDKIFVENNYIFDVPSTLFLEPNAFYRYHRTGITDTKNYLTILDKKADLDNGSKVLEISSWNTSPLIDYSGYNNNGIIYNNLPSFYKSEIELNGDNHVIFPANIGLLDEYKMSVSLWLNVEDWAKISGRQIFGNFYNSGFGLLNESAIPAALFTFINGYNGEIYNLNYNLKICSFASSTSGNVVNPDSYYSIHRLPDLSFWIFDKLNGRFLKFDAEGKLLFTVENYYNIDQVETDHEGNLYLLNKFKSKIFKLNYLGNQVDIIALNNLQTTRIELFLENNQEISVIEIFGNASVIDNSGNIWQSLGSNLYKTPYDSKSGQRGQPSLFAMVGNIQQISCDSDNNLWILHDEDSISIMSQDGIFKTARLGKRAGFPLNVCEKNSTRFRYINFVRFPEPEQIDCDKYLYSDYAVIIDSRDNELFVLNKELDLMSKLNLQNLPKLIDSTKLLFFAEGDFSGFQNLRKFYLGSKKISWKIKIGNLDYSNPEIISLSYNSEKLKKGWHHFAFTFDSNSGYIRYFIDSELVSEKRIPVNKKIIYDYHSSLLLGTDSIKNTSLNDIIGVQNSYKFKGKVSDLKVYNKFLSKGDITQIYISSPRAVSKLDMTWNLTTGSRNYIEEINHWFQMRLPGSKSKYFNINIHNFPMISELKPIIEDSIRKNITKISPAQTSLYKINWL